jgi:hypothetical protein
MNKPKSKPSKPAAVVPLEVAPNQQAASSSWDVPLAVLKAAKAAGCPAFSPGGRINRTGFFAWLQTHEGEADHAVALDLAKADRQELDNEKIRAQIRLLRSRNERESRSLITMTEARAEWSRCIAIAQEEFKSLMEPDHYRVACVRWKSRCGEVLPS